MFPLLSFAVPPPRGGWLRAMLLAAALLLLAAGRAPAQAVAAQTDTARVDSVVADSVSRAAAVVDTQPAARGSATPARDTTLTTLAGAQARARVLSDSLRHALERLARPGGWGEFPEPAWLAFLVIVLLGALGALAGDLVADGGRLDRWRRDDTGWILGFPGRLLIGVVSALIVVLGIQPPSGSWPLLMSTALAVGAASEAILLAVMASWKARMAEKEVQRVTAVADSALEGARRDVRSLTGRGGVALVGKALAPFPMQDAVDQLDRSLARAQSQLRVEAEAPLLGTSRTSRALPSILSLEDTPMPSKTVVIAYSVPGTDNQILYVDDRPVIQDNDGLYRVMAGPGVHTLLCRAQTRPSTEYEIEIQEPEEARWTPEPPRKSAPSGIINDPWQFIING